MISLPLNFVVPLARWWVDAQEARILGEGVPLTPTQAADAQLVGVEETAKVRLLSIEVIPTPLDRLLCWSKGLARFVSGGTIGITLGHCIYLRRDFWANRPLLVHELVHVAQYERFGSSAAFLRAYLDECLTTGYPHGPLEQEALVRAAEICRRS